MVVHKVEMKISWEAFEEKKRGLFNFVFSIIIATTIISIVEFSSKKLTRIFTVVRIHNGQEISKKKREIYQF